MNSPFPPLASGYREFERGLRPAWAGRLVRDHASSAHGRGAQRHPYAVVVLVTQGRVRTRHGGQWAMKESDVHLIPPGDPHASSFERTQGWALCFWPEPTRHPLRLFYRVREGCHPVLHLEPELAARVESRLREIASESERDEPGRNAALAAWLQLVLVELERAAPPLSPALSDAATLARRALTQVELHALKALSLSDVAKALGRSSAHVASVVKAETGRTVGEWILAQRMGEARRRLLETDDGVDAIANQVGYADVTHFIRLFRREHGVTPANWRRAQRDGSAASAGPSAILPTP